jgi:hypothetical protein
LPWHEALTDPLRDILRMLRWIPVRTGGVKPRADQLAAYRHFVAAMAARAFRRYRPPFYPGTITLVQTAETKYRMNDRRPLIARYARDARKVSIPGTRTGLFARPAVDELARQLQACLDQAGASEPTDADCSSRREEALIAPSAQ